MIRTESINRFFNGLPFSVLIVVVLLLSAALFSISSGSAVNSGGGGLFFTSASLHLQNRWASLGVNLAAIIVSGVLVYLLNKTFSFIRAVTCIFVSAFFMLEAANPYLSSSLLDGTLLCVILLSATFILFNSYNDRSPQRSIFITSFILALGAMFHYICLYLIPVFFIGFMQMRAMSLKGVLAMGLGIITPLWILMGSGIVAPADFVPIAMHNVWESLSTSQSWTMISTIATECLVVIGLMIVNLIHIYSYKTQVRAYNGFFTVLTIATIIIMALDYGNILNYLPVLNCCLSIQIAHAYTISNGSRRYLAILALIAVCVAAYITHYFYL